MGGSGWLSLPLTSPSIGHDVQHHVYFEYFFELQLLGIAHMKTWDANSSMQKHPDMFEVSFGCAEWAEQFASILAVCFSLLALVAFFLLLLLNLPRRSQDPIAWETIAYTLELMFCNVAA